MNSIKRVTVYNWAGPSGHVDIGAGGSQTCDTEVIVHVYDDWVEVIETVHGKTTVRHFLGGKVDKLQGSIGGFEGDAWPR